MKHADEIIKEAFEKYNPAKVLLLFSGGHDSLVSTHFAASYLRLKNIPFTVYHGDTTIGIPETQQFVKDTCKAYGWNLMIQQPPVGDRYEDIVREHGFPGPSNHPQMYRRLKERALRAYVTHQCKSSPYARENVLLISGARKSESMIRMGYQHEVKKEKGSSRVWAAPLFWWSEKQCKEYIKGNRLSRNPVKEKLCISGECLCGCFANKEERAEIKAAYPHVHDRLIELEEIASMNDHPWPWGYGGSAEWYSNHPPGQLDMFMPMCVGCESKRA